MSQDKELEIQRQFLDEAQEYLNTLEAALIGLASQRIDSQKINAALRATHSIKGGAGMMGFHTLSDLAHRLEDSFKVLKTQKQTLVIDADLENLLLSGVDCLRFVIHSAQDAYVNRDRAPGEIDAYWLETQANPVFEHLHQRLGDPEAEDAVSVLSPEDSQDLLPILFETEVEGCLQRLEAVLATPNQPCLREEVSILAQELSGLGEMLQLNAFHQLCESVVQSIELHPQESQTIAQLALQAWRRSQALVLAQQLDLLPVAIEYSPNIDLSNSLDATPFAPSLEPFDELIEAASKHSVEFLTEQWHEPPLEQSEFIMPTVQHDWASDLAAVAEPRRSQPDRPITDFKVLEVKPDDLAAAIAEDPDATVRVPVKQLNQLNDLLGELTIERTALDLYLKRLRSLSRTLKQRVKILDQANSQVRTAYDKSFRLPALELGLNHHSHNFPNSDSPAYPLLPIPIWLNAFGDPSGTAHVAAYPLSPPYHEFDSLEMDRYSDLHLLSQQMIEAIVQIQEVTSDIELSLDDAEQTARDWTKTAKQMQTSLAQVRMRPLSDITDRFPRALRDLCLQHGKQANLKVIGGNTLIDRNILEALNDPLMHLLRNAFDHGIEDPETRIAHGKPETGTIAIQAFHQGNRTWITLSDDGGGIPIEKVRAKAEQMGLDASLLAIASDEELLSLIFEPGFSTADQVTALSGRGVGMDVVRDSLKQVRGEITVNTQAGKGTTFTISLPFTLSVVRVLLVESHGMMLAFPTDAIREVVILPPDEIKTTADTDVFAWGEAIAQLIELSRWLEFNCSRLPTSSEALPTINVPTVLITHQGTQQIGIQVDRCWGEQEIAVRRVEGPIPLPAGFTHCTILGDGRVVPLVDVPALLHWIASHSATSTTTQTALQPSPSTLPKPLSLAPAAPRDRAPATQQPTILIVDDSINVRRFLALTLEKAGYYVEQARDGQDALEQLQRGLQVQAIFCDIEMPRLDGYGFLARIKAQPSLDHLPVIMLTSRNSDKHRRLAMQLGATAYFSKPYNEQTLLRSLEQILGVGLLV